MVLNSKKNPSILFFTVVIISIYIHYYITALLYFIQILLLFKSLYFIKLHDSCIKF